MDIYKLKYLLNDTVNQIIWLIENVLSDSETDPHFSAVDTTNRIKCYIQIMTELGDTLPYHDVKSFFKRNGFTEEEFQLFEEKRRKESGYYRGVQF